MVSMALRLLPVYVNILTYGTRWSLVVLARDALMELRDMDHSGGFSGDTVCVRTDQTRAEALLELTRNWHPDDVEAIGVNEMQEMKDFRLPSGAQPDKYRALQWAFNKSTDVIIWAWWD